MVKTKYFYIMGSASGVGKTTLCEGLLSQLLFTGYLPEKLAYIKPMTQCIDKQGVTGFCENKGIAHRSIGSVVFNKGFSKGFIDGSTKNSVELLKELLATISQISENKDIVIVDGIGNPSTGSVIGISNVDIAVSLNAPVLFVGKAGIGSAIDDTILAVNFMQQGGIKNIALVYNKVKSSELLSVKYYLSKCLAGLLPNIPVLDFIINHPHMDNHTIHRSAALITNWFKAQ